MDDFEQELDRLYTVEPSEFVAARDRFARELREAGEREQADEVKALRKPTVSAWTINQLARQERREVDLLLDAGHRLREAQQGLLAGADRGSFDEAMRTQREALGNLHGAAKRILAEAGRESDSTLNQVMGTLQAAAISTEGRELLALGRLTGDVEASGFELLAPLAEGLAPVRPRRRQAEKKREAPKKPAPRAREREAQAAQERQRQEDRKRLEEARRSLREARADAKEAEKALRGAAQAADKARRELTRAEELVQKCEAAAAAAQTALEQAEQELREAEKKAR